MREVMQKFNKENMGKVKVEKHPLKIITRQLFPPLKSTCRTHKTSDWFEIQTSCRFLSYAKQALCS